jgi:hypothetical protein
LIYLRGRVDPDWDAQERYYRRAIQADSRQPWPLMALGVRAAAAGKWADCLRDLKKAQELKIDEELVLDQLQSALLATGAAKTMVTEYQRRVAANPLDFNALVLLIEMIAASGPPELIERELAAWENRLPIGAGAARGAVTCDCRIRCRQAGGLRAALSPAWCAPDPRASSSGGAGAEAGQGSGSRPGVQHALG